MILQMRARSPQINVDSNLSRSRSGLEFAWNRSEVSMSKQIAWSALILLAGCSSLFGAGLPPWSFGMTKEQVTGIVDRGPYKSFSNGDLETYNGEFHGQKRNVQFFFNVSGLNRIEINMYEGQELDQAIAAFETVYVGMNREYGDLKASGFDLPVPCDAHKAALAAGEKVEQGTKAQLAPILQNQDVVTFSSFRKSDVMGHTFYNVVIYLDPANRKDMPMVPPLLAKPPAH